MEAYIPLQSGGSTELIIIWTYVKILLEFVGCCPLCYINYVRYCLL